MCLRNEDLHMVYSPAKKTYIGKGYKSMPSYDGGKSCRVRGGELLKVGVWYDALTVQNRADGERKKKLRTIYQTYDGPDYPAGFHIFLNPKHASRYGSKDTVYEVEYCDIIGFGKNKYNQGNNSGPCVIAHKMRILRKLDRTEIK